MSTACSVVHAPAADNTVLQLLEPQYVLIKDQDATLIAVAEQGPPGPPGPEGPPGAGGSAPVTSPPIASGSGGVLEALDASVYRSTKWILTITCAARDEFRMCEIMAFHDGNGGANHVVYGSFGANLSYNIDVTVVNNELTLEVTNTDTDDLVFDAVRVGNILI